MDRATQTLRTLAVMTLILCLATILYQLSLLSSVTSTFAAYESYSSVFNSFVWITCSALGLAAGVAAVVIAAQHHHRRWLLGLLIPTVITPYGPLVAVLITPRVLFSSSGAYTYLRLVTLSYTLLPFVTALVVLAYSVRSQRQSSVALPSDESDLDIEYSRLD